MTTMTNQESDNLMKTNTWIPSDGQPIKNKDGDTEGFISKSRRFVTTRKHHEPRKENAFHIPTRILENTLQHAVDWIDIIYTQNNGDRILHRASPETFIKHGEQNGDHTRLKRNRFDYVYSEQQEQYLDPDSFTRQGQQQISNW